MFYKKESKNVINSPPKNTLRLTYQNRSSSLDELLKLGKSVSILCRNFQYYLTELYKVKMSLSQPIMNYILTLNNFELL